MRSDSSRCRRALARLLCLLFVFVAGLGGCRSTPQQPQDVVLIVVDTLRADRLGSYGYAAAHTPVLDALAKRGTRFAHAYAPSSWTMPSIASLFTSRLPSQHQVSAFDSRLHDDEVTLAERLALGGFIAGGFTANWRLSRELGFAQGFTRWQPIMVEGKTRAELVRRAALTWLDETPDAAEGPRSRRLLYFQFMEPHMPLVPPAALRERYAPGISEADAVQLSREANDGMLTNKPVGAHQAQLLSRLYDGEVAAMDAEIGLLFDALAARGRLEHALIIVTADHGEEFLEHGAIGHGYNLYNTTVEVPLIIAGPGIAAGRVVEQPVSLIDIGPTLLDLLGLQAEVRHEGRSLVPLLRGDTGAGADIILQLPRTNAKRDVREHREGLIRGTDKLLITRDGTPRTYDLATDPGERAPRDRDDGLHAALIATTAELELRRQPKPVRVELDDATREKLRALGYAN